MRTPRRFAACVLLATAAVAPAASAQPPSAPPGTHFVWRVAKDAKTIAWLVGSVHVLTKDAYPLPAVFERAFAEVMDRAGPRLQRALALAALGLVLGAWGLALRG